MHIAIANFSLLSVKGPKCLPPSTPIWKRP
jgi:hypothetical protein